MHFFSLHTFLLSHLSFYVILLVLPILFALLEVLNTSNSSKLSLEPSFWRRRVSQQLSAENVAGSVLPVLLFIDYRKSYMI